ncbi:cystatin-B-like [Stegostoma tigrinum]|uniref:cystatin-B-like n=1 Tax=Stegostoma tigrinum TaxID=3053191 RepID=UPI00202B6530|nr:cystatin-B-like [Stegostoma tigrinum]
MSRQLCGGVGSEKTATPDIQQIADSMKSKIEEKANKTFDVFVVKSYKTQIVSGTNYFMKIHVGGDDYIHVRLYQDLPCRNSEREISAVQTNKLHTDELAYF